MNRIFKSLLLCLIITSCCREDSVETHRYGLDADEIALLPYQKGEEINFVHSNGFSFDFKVTEDKSEWIENHDFCEWNCCGNDYYSYQMKTSILESSYPRFQIEFSMGGTKGYNTDARMLNIKMNHFHNIHFPYDTLANFVCDGLSNTTCYDSIALNDRMFYNVVQRNFNHYDFENDSSELAPMSLYFNYLGMIQLEMSNNETYTFNN